MWKQENIAQDPHQPTLENAAASQNPEKRTLRSRQKRFASFEHSSIGRDAFREFTEQHAEFFAELEATGRYNAWNNSLKISDTLWLEASEIVALSGDFYGASDQPICFGKDDADKAERFRKAYANLANASEHEVDAILRVMKQERDTVVQALKADQSPKVALEKGSLARELKYWNIQRYSVLPIPFFASQYTDLAQMNFDHFGLEAREAYRIGHSVALATAKAARKAGDPELFLTAMSQELSAQHYLTDCFAAGHARTPRKAIYDYVNDHTAVPGKQKIAGLLAKAMHDEDNKAGLTVTSEDHPEPWKSYGDDSYFEQGNEENAAQIHNAVMASLNDLTLVYSGQNPTNGYLRFLPTPTTEGNHPPLFKVEEGVLKIRDANNDYHSDFDVLPTLARVLRQKPAAPEEKDEPMSDDQRVALLKKLESLDAENDDISVERLVM